MSTPQVHRDATSLHGCKKRGMEWQERVNRVRAMRRNALGHRSAGQAWGKPMLPLARSSRGHCRCCQRIARAMNTSRGWEETAVVEGNSTGQNCYSFESGDAFPAVLKEVTCPDSVPAIGSMATSMRHGARAWKAD